jgi:glucose-6-phosphate-specific signal transduction histidine kinase
LRGIRQRTGVGITGMRERVRYLHGPLNISSNASGTRISVMLPIVSAPLAEPRTIFHHASAAIQ